MGNILKQLAQRDVNALLSIYKMRCLTQQQIYELHYRISTSGDIVGDAYCKKKINDFMDLKLVEKLLHVNEVYFLTSTGVELVRTCFDLPSNIYDTEKKIVRRGYYRASELKISPKYINHQIALNQFMIDFMQYKHEIFWKYFDEKYISSFKNIRPDGLLNMLDVDFFIEIDMGTESKKQLYDKWENYRRFLDSREYELKERKIIVLFVVENVENVEGRIDLVMHTLSERLMDKIDSNLEFYINTKDKIIEILNNKILMAKELRTDINDDIFRIFANHGFSVALGEKIKNYFNGVEYEFYCRKINEDNKIVVENGKIQEYIIDNYINSPFSVLKKIAFLNYTNSFFRDKFKRDLAYIVVAESEQQIYDALKTLDLLSIDNVYFTTIERMKNRPFYKAIFQFDFIGNIHVFENNGLKNRIFEINIEDI